MKHGKPIDPVSTWHQLIENEENVIYLSVAYLRQTETMTNTSNAGSQHLKTQGTNSPIRPSSDEFFRNYGTCNLRNN